MLAILFLSLLGIGLSVDLSSGEDEGEVRDIVDPPSDVDLDRPDIVGDAASELLNGTGGDNTIEAGRGDDTLNGFGGDDVLFGGSGDDLLTGGQGDDYGVGGSGDDLIILGDGDDISSAPVNSFEERGNDTVLGGNGNDFLVDSRGDDEIYGGNGDDLLIASDNFRAAESPSRLPDDNTGDILDGGAGDDVLEADQGDTLTGGSGDDVFALITEQNPSGEAAVITDFDTDEDIFTVLPLEFGRAEPDVTFVANTAAGSVDAFVDGHKVAELQGLSASDIPDIETVVTFV